MSKRHQASRRRTYARRLHELHERRDRGWRPADVDSDAAEDELGVAEAVAADVRSMALAATWIGLE
jgi:hypothetical protein